MTIIANKLYFYYCRNTFLVRPKMWPIDGEGGDKISKHLVRQYFLKFCHPGESYYMNWILQLVPVKLINFKPSYNWFKY